jgi:RHS repeat-associated protein
VNHRVFSAYGQLLSQTDLSGARPAPATVDCLFGYTGRPLDQATGLQNNNARWYDAITGRWLSEDHIWDGVNLYRYVGNGPTNAADPTGLGFMYYLEPVSGPAGNGVGGNGGAVVNAGGGFEIPFVLYSAPPSAYLPANPAQTTARWWNPFSWYESAPKGCFSVGRPLPPPNSAEITPLCSTGNIAQDRINRWQYDMFLQWQYDMFPQGYPGPGWGWSGWSNGIPPGAWSAFQQMQSIQQINVPQSPAPISGP